MKLAILGHPTRGKEVIEILKMLGGYASCNFKEDSKDEGYYLDNSQICCKHYTYLDDYMIFSLEKFLRQYPYKIGDRVYVPEYESPVRIDKMYWYNGQVYYQVFTDEEEDFTAEELQPYNKESKMNKAPKTQEEVNKYLLENRVKNAQNLLDIEQCLNNDGLVLPENTVINSEGIGSIDFIKWYEKSKYPKTYAECREILGLKTFLEEPYLKLFGKESGNSYLECRTYYNAELMNSLYKLLICRDAYLSLTNSKASNAGIYYIIYSTKIGDIIKTRLSNSTANYILSFPTEEMMVAFYDNFKDLIEKCKDLLQYENYF